MTIDLVIAAILIGMVLVIFRAISGPTTYDRILAANTFGTKTVILIIMLAYVTGEMMLLDIALVYIMINFITTIGFLKFFKYKSLGKE